LDVTTKVEGAMPKEQSIPAPVHTHIDIHIPFSAYKINSAYGSKSARVNTFPVFTNS
jgi:hypothetical protein